MTSLALKLAILVISIYGTYQSPLADPSRGVSSAASVLASTSATLLGFVIAASAAIITVTDKPFLANLRKTGHINKLWDVMTQSAFWIGASFLLALISFFVPHGPSLTLTGTSLGCIIVGCVNFADASKKLLKIFKRL
ncbi:hypothetical protein [Halomonas alkaliantarctica]|uniref:hypothetical protein n=1 Tax=Halomonas alkaliantarctica TaxID=232346 RepID=UPI002659D039|nr:hypothetical protein [Halomonas alkaliantarctica]